MIKYLGSKRKLLPWILEAIGPAEGRTALDLMSGTARVGHALKRAGFRVLANDHNAYAYHLARCYVEADRDDVEPEARRLLAELARLPGEDGPFTEVFCERARYLHPKNGRRVDAIRRAIDDIAPSGTLRSVLLVSLLEAADRVDSTCGVQMAYLKQWAKRAHNDLELRFPDVLPRAEAGGSQAFELDALVAAQRLIADVAYVDPPYNQHSYLGNYHVWETLVRGDYPAVYGVAMKRIDVKERRSDFNSRRRSKAALTALVDALSVEKIAVSFNDEGYLTEQEITDVLARRGRVTALSCDYKRYVGAQIGIHDPRGNKVGRISHLRNRELLFLVDVEAPAIRAAPSRDLAVATPAG